MRKVQDGTRAILFEPLELIERLVVLIQVPRANLVRMARHARAWIEAPLAHRAG